MLPPATHCRLGDALSNRWSAPAFVKVTGVELGLVGGVDRVGTMYIFNLFQFCVDALLCENGAGAGGRHGPGALPSAI